MPVPLPEPPPTGAPPLVPQRLRQFWKILASGFLFTCLGLGGILYSLVVLPTLYLLPGGPEPRKRRATALIHRSFRLFIIGLEGSGILKIHARNLPDPEALKGRLVVANHPSYLDIVVLLALLPDTVCVVKNGVWNNPFFGPLVRAAGFVPITSAEHALDAAVEALRRGLTLVVFPEGTRTRRGRPLAFQRGAAYLALRTGAEVLPVVIHVDPPLLEKDDKWYNIPICTCQFAVNVEAPFDAPAEGTDPMPEPLRARMWTEALATFFQEKLHGLQHQHP